jgi:malate synthase
VTIVESIDLEPDRLAEITDADVRTNVIVGVRYVASWLAAADAVAIQRLTEDAATAEISRAQLCEWARHGVRTTSGRMIDADYIRYVVRRELGLLTCGLGPATKARFERAAELFTEAALTEHIVQPKSSRGAPTA